MICAETPSHHLRMLQDGSDSDLRAGNELKTAVVPFVDQRVPIDGSTTRVLRLELIWTIEDRLPLSTLMSLTGSEGLGVQRDWTGTGGH